MNRFTINQLQPKDFQKLEEIDKSVFPVKSQQSNFQEIHQNNKLLSYVAHTCLAQPGTHSFPVGYISILSINVESEIISICVDKNYRHLGIGQALIALSLQKLSLLGCKSVFLEVRRSNLIAQSIYSKFSFVKIGVRNKYYTDNFEDALTMSLNSLQNKEYNIFLKSKLQSLGYVIPTPDTK